MPAVEDLMDEWLKSFSLEEILEAQDIEESEVLFILWKGGYISLPGWLEDWIDELQPGEEEA